MNKLRILVWQRKEGRKEKEKGEEGRSTVIIEGLGQGKEEEE